MELSDLRTRVQANFPTNYHSSELDNDKIDEFLNSAKDWVCKGSIILPGIALNHNFSFLKQEVTRSTTDQIQTYSLPVAGDTDWTTVPSGGTVRKFKLDDTCELVNSEDYRLPLIKQLKRNMEEKLDFRNTVGYGVPTYYCIDGDYLWFYKIPDHSCNDVMAAPLAHWKLNDNLDTSVVLDASANSNDGVVANGENNYSSEQYNSSGKINGCFDFDGTNDSVSIAYSAVSVLNFGASTDFSVCAWFKTSNDGDDMFIYDKFKSGGGYFYIRKDISNKLSASISDGTDTVTILSDSVINDNAWHNVIVTADRDGNMSMYVDKTLQTNIASIAAVGDIDNTDDIIIGSLDGSAQFWNGSLDDIRVYNEVLTANKIALIYNAGIGTEDAQPVIPYTINLEFYGYLADLSADSDSNVLTDSYPDVLEWKATAAGFRFGFDIEQAEYYENKAKEEIVRMISTDQDKTFGALEEGMMPDNGQSLNFNI